MSFHYNNLKLKQRRLKKHFFLLPNFVKYEKFIKILKFMLYSQDLNKQIKVLIIFYLCSLKSYVSSTQHKNVCLLTGQSKGVYTKVKMRRGSFREHAGALTLPGFSIAS